MHQIIDLNFPYGAQSRQHKHVPTLGQFLPHIGDIRGLEDRCRRDRYRLLEERPVQDSHGPVHRRTEHGGEVAAERLGGFGVDFHGHGAVDLVGYSGSED